MHQKVWCREPSCLPARQELWHALSQALHDIPARQGVVLAGDFNVTLRPDACYVGSGVPKNPTQATDVTQLQTLIQAHNRCALNTWGCAPGFTFQFGSDKQSQIDYVFMRVHQVDAQAKQAAAIHKFPVGRHVSSDAAFHFPIHASLPFRWKALRYNAPSRCDVNALALSVQHKKHDQTDCLREVATNWANHYAVSDLDPEKALYSLSDELKVQATRAFPTALKCQPAPWQDELQTGRAKYMWALFRKMRQHKKSLKGFFESWRCWAKFHILHKAYRARCSGLRKQKLRDVLQEAELAACRNATWGMFRIVRRLAPRTKPRKFQIQPKGMVLSMDEELTALGNYYRDLYNSNSTVPLPVHTLSKPFRVDVSKLSSYLDLIPLRKAVMPTAAPGAAFRVCADLVAPTLARIIESMWTTSRINIPGPMQNSFSCQKLASSPMKLRTGVLSDCSALLLKQ